MSAQGVAISREELALLPGVANRARGIRLPTRSDGTWSLMFFGDVQGGFTYLPSTLDSAAALGVAAIAVGGDVSRGTGHLHLATRELRGHPPRVPLFAVAGNHDVKTDADRALFERSFGSTGFEFHIGDTLVLGLDCTEREQELRLLRENLDEADKRGEQVVIVRHFPVWRGSPGAPDGRLMEEIRGRRVRLVLSGHGHTPSLDVVDGIQFVVTPAMGDRSEGQGQTPLSYLLVHWDGSQFRVERHDRFRSNALDLRSAVDHLLLAHAVPLISPPARTAFAAGSGW
jgi:predicted phosphodiesterase